VFGGAVATASLIGVALIPLGVAAWRAGEIDTATTALLYDAGAVANLATAFPNAAYLLATWAALRRRDDLPWALAAGAALVAAIHLASAACLARAGAFSPTGALPVLAPLAHTAWIASVGAVLWRRAGIALRPT
jgi:hypothetical protein